MNAIQLNFYKTCRICLVENENLSNFTIHSNTLWDKILNLSKNLQGFNLPDRVCSECDQEFRTAQKFLDKCEKTNAVLQTYCQDKNQYLLPNPNEYFANRQLFVPYATTPFENSLIDSKDKILSIASEDIGSVFNIKLGSQLKRRRRSEKRRADKRFMEKLKGMSIKGGGEKKSACLGKSILVVDRNIVEFVNKSSNHRNVSYEKVTMDNTTTDTYISNFFGGKALNLSSALSANSDRTINVQEMIDTFETSVNL